VATGIWLGDEWGFEERSPQEPRPRYQREKPGEIIHLDIKKLGRFNSIGHRITGGRTGHCTTPGVRGRPPGV
jgi:hypothetical protein